MKAGPVFRITLAEAESITWRDRDVIAQETIARAERWAASNGAPRCSIYSAFGNLVLSVPAPR